MKWKLGDIFKQIDFNFQNSFDLTNFADKF